MALIYTNLWLIPHLNSKTRSEKLHTKLALLHSVTWPYVPMLSMPKTAVICLKSAFKLYLQAKCPCLLYVFILINTTEHSPHTQKKSMHDLHDLKIGARYEENNKSRKTTA